MIAIAPAPKLPTWAHFAGVGLLVGAAAVVAFRVALAPATLDAATTCTSLVRAACERQRACPGCAPHDVACSRVVAAELPACVARAAPGEHFSAAAVDACVASFHSQECSDACATYSDPVACKPFEGLSGGP